MNLFFILSETDFANYADDNTPYISSNDVNGLMKSLKEASKKLFKWLDDSLMKSNPEKCRLLVSTNDNVKIRIRNFQIENTKREKVLGIQFDNKLSFDYHLSEICKKTSIKLHGLVRVTPYMDLSKRKILMSAFFNSQFSYCPLIWMFHSRIINKKINRLHKRCFRIIYCDKQSSFEILLEKDSSISIHEKNIQILATEMYKVRKGMSPPQITELFTRRDEHPYNLRHNAEFLQSLVNSVRCVTDSILHLGPKIWGMVSDTYKNRDILYNVKKPIKNLSLKTVLAEFSNFL